MIDEQAGEDPKVHRIIDGGEGEEAEWELRLAQKVERYEKALRKIVDAFARVDSNHLIGKGPSEEWREAANTASAALGEG